MKMTSENSNAAVMKELGARIKRGRLDIQMLQKELVFPHVPYLLPRTAEISVWKVLSGYCVYWAL